MWHGTAEGVVDLQPLQFDESQVSDVSGNRQVGSATWRYPNGEGTTHAIVWNGTAESAIDLHQYLNLPGISQSGATSIAANGDIVGWASGPSGNYTYAVLWRLVPEPSTGTLVCCGLLAAACFRRRTLARSMPPNRSARSAAVSTTWLASS